MTADSYVLSKSCWIYRTVQEMIEAGEMVYSVVNYYTKQED